MVSKSYIRQLIFDLTPYFDPFTAHDETYSSYFACNKGSTMYIIILQSQYEIIQIMVASNINIKNISYIILACCDSYGQCITIAINFEGKMAENLQICCKYIHISKCY